WIALAVWLTVSLFAIQLLTWVRTGLPNGSDPVTLLLCSATGNFVHEPVSGKHLISEIVGVVWLVVTIWSWRQKGKHDAYFAKQIEGLKSLERAIDLQGVK